MMNRLSEGAISTIQGLATCRFSLREISRLTGCHTITVNKYVRKIRDKMICECGESINHKGWCNTRLLRSTPRRRFLRRWGKNVEGAGRTIRGYLRTGNFSGFGMHEVHCRICVEPFIKLWNEDSFICYPCKLKLLTTFETKKADSEYRVKYRALRKQMAELGHLITQARKLIHENNE